MCIQDASLRLLFAPLTLLLLYVLSVMLGRGVYLKIQSTYFLRERPVGQMPGALLEEVALSQTQGRAWPGDWQGCGWEYLLLEHLSGTYIAGSQADRTVCCVAG